MTVFARNKLFNNVREIRTDKDYICAVILTTTIFKDIEILGIRLSSTNISLEEYKRSIDAVFELYDEHSFSIICGDLNSDINKTPKSERAGTLFNKLLNWFLINTAELPGRKEPLHSFRNIVD